MSQIDEASTSSSTGMPTASALVVLGFLAAAVILRLAAHMAIRDIVVLQSATGGISVAVLLAASLRTRGGQLLQRVLKAVLTSGAGS